MNGNDAIALLKSEDKLLEKAEAVDLIGQIGLGDLIREETGWSNIKDTTATYRVDSVNQTQGKVINYIVQDLDINGQNFGPFWLAWTRNHTLVRKPSVKEGVKLNPSPFIVDLEWDTVPGGANQWDSLNFHTCECTPLTNIIPEPDKGQAQVFPNPVRNGIFTLHASHEIYSYEILGITGQLIDRKYPATALSSTSVAVRQLKPGIYFIRTVLKGSDEKVILKFIIQ
jgi:hypothetical protein